MLISHARHVLLSESRGRAARQDEDGGSDIRSQSEKCARVIQIKDLVFPQNSEKTPKRCTKDNFKTVMRNRNAALIQFAQTSSTLHLSVLYFFDVNGLFWWWTLAGEASFEFFPGVVELWRLRWLVLKQNLLIMMIVIAAILKIARRSVTGYDSAWRPWPPSADWYPWIEQEDPACRLAASALLCPDRVRESPEPNLRTLDKRGPLRPPGSGPGDPLSPQLLQPHDGAQ